MTFYKFKPDSARKERRAEKRKQEAEERGARQDSRDSRDARKPRRSGRTQGAKQGKGRGTSPGTERNAGGTPELSPSKGLGRNAFSSILRDLAREGGLSDQLLPEPAPLARLDYARELELKNAALRAFWLAHQIPDKPNKVIASPEPRHYRSTSKRRLVPRGAGWDWDFFTGRPASEAATLRKAGVHWPLEPEGHQAVYRKALEKLSDPAYRALAGALNFLIVRGGEQRMVLFNVHRMSQETVRKAKMLAGHLVADPATGVVAAHLFHDPSQSNYYLEARGPVHSQRLKKLVGPEYLPIDVAGRRYFLHPLGFFQVNLSILPRVIEEVKRALKPAKSDRLLDLYCGCGLFTFPLAAECAEALGVEFSPVSLDAAALTAGRERTRNVRFKAGKLEVSRLRRLLPEADETPEILLLDPPAQGTPQGLVRALAERQPRRVAHLFCGMDALPGEVKNWRKQGYMIAKVIPFDMFPGTDNLEVLVVLIPDKYGILNRKKVKVEAID